MKEMVRIRSIDEYFKTYAVEGIGKGMDRMMVRSQLIDAFHKEMYGLVAMRTKKESDIKDIARRVAREEIKKWKALIKRFEMYRETSGLLKEDDLKMNPEDIVADGEEEAEDNAEASGEV